MDYEVTTIKTSKLELFKITINNPKFNEPIIVYVLDHAIAAPEPLVFVESKPKLSESEIQKCK